LKTAGGIESQAGNCDTGNSIPRKQTRCGRRPAVDAAQVNLDYCEIRSPINGRIGLRQVDVGNTVTAGSNGAVLVTIDNLDPIYTDFNRRAEPDIPLVSVISAVRTSKS
jgi:multidrug efflux pump subunit AcrA (membrane-fusion protein)